MRLWAGKTRENAAWAYPEPLAKLAAIKDCLSFDDDMALERKYQAPDSINPPNDDSGQDDGGEEVSGQLVIACDDASEVFDSPEHAFD